MIGSVVVIGAGYVGLTTGVCLAELGHRVTCVDIDPVRIDRLARGESPIHERGLAELLARGLESGLLSFTVDANDAVIGAEFVFLAVPTPRSGDGTADLSHLRAAAEGIASDLEPNAIVINKSTVPVGSSNFVERIIGRDDVHVVSNPEFLREGSAIEDFFDPDRIVVGSDDEHAVRRLSELYERLPAQVLVTDPASAEMIKYASNAFLAMKLSFVNEISNLCELLGACADDVLQGMGHDTRIGRPYLEPGPGWGGSCFPKDSRALLEMARAVDYRFGMLEAVLESNERQFDVVVDKVARMVGGEIVGARVAVWGLTFKAGTDDRRESPAVEIVRRLIGRGALVTAFDPTVTGGIIEVPTAAVAPDEISACSDASVLVVLTEWEQFARIDPSLVLSVMATPRVVDARNLLDCDAYRRYGFDYSGLGR